jgi:3-methyladenine DNA glycosylase Mpg
MENEKTTGRGVLLRSKEPQEGSEHIFKYRSSREQRQQMGPPSAPLRQNPNEREHSPQV